MIAAQFARSAKNMKPLTAIIIYVIVTAIAHAEGDREFTSKAINIKFETFEAAQKWSIRGLDFEEWLKAVSRPEWKELHRSKNEEFYFAIYRSGDHLIFCQNDRKNAYRGASTSVRASNDDVAYSVWDKPSLVTILKWNVSYPSGASGGQEVFTTWKIKDGFTGDIILEYSVKNDGTPYREALRQPVTWKAQEAEQAAPSNGG